MAETIDDSLTKRILVDASQWEAMFSAGAPPSGQLRDLRWPFESVIYVEPTRPIMPASINILDEGLREAGRMAGFDPEREQSYIRALLILPTGRTHRTLCTISTWAGQILTHTMDLNPNDGEALSRMEDDTLEPPGAGGWEPGLQYFAGAALNLLAHINARGVTLEAERLPRQQRRRLEREGKPNPWYVIRGWRPDAEETP